MRIIFSILISILFVQILAGQDILDKRISAAYEEDKVKFILQDLNRRFDLDLKYNADNLPNVEGSYSFKDTRLRDVLNIILKDLDFNYLLSKTGKVVIAPKEVVTDEMGSKDTFLKDEKLSADDAEQYIIGSRDLQRGNDTAIIRVRLQEVETFNPIADAVVLIKNTGAVEVSDISGEFSFSLKPGLYTLEITALSHETKLVELDLRSSDLLELNLTKKAYLIEEVVISGKGAAHNVKQTITGLELLNKKEIRKLPAFMGEADVIKSLLSFTGVSSIGEGASGFNVRGGSIDQNLILQDGALVFNPSHILGFFSIFNPDVVSNSALYKGHIPANFGGRISSVLDVNMREGNMEFTTVSGSIGAIASKLTVDLPLAQNKTSLLISGRSSYSKYLIGDIRDLDVARSLANFYDVQGKLTHKFSDNTKLVGSYYQSKDRFRFSDEFGYGWTNQIANLRLGHILSDDLSFSADLSYGKINNQQFTLDNPLAFTLDSGIGYLNFKSQVLNKRGAHLIKAGIEAISYKTSPEQLGPNEDSQIKQLSVAKEDGRELAVYVNDQFEINQQLSLDAGLRYSVFQQVGPATVNTYADDLNPTLDQSKSSQQIDGGVIKTYQGLEPRISIRYAFIKQASIKLSYNRINQYIHLVSNTATPTPVDIWQVSNTHIKPLVANNYSFGVFGTFDDQYDVAADVYYKDLENTLDYKDFSAILLNPHLETAVVRGVGRAYGAEISIEKINSAITGKISYNYSRTERRTPPGITSVNRGNWFPSNFDQPHTVKANFNWQISKRATFSMNFLYNTGRPITGVSSNYLLQNVIVTNFSDRNDFRLPDYHRLDMSYTFNLNRRKSARFKSDINLALYNVYGRKNAFSIFYRQLERVQTNAYKLSVVGATIPSISYNFSW